VYAVIYLAWAAAVQHSFAQHRKDSLALSGDRAGVHGRVA
jgi:hypothetical protein